MKRILGFVMAMILMACIPAALAAPGDAILGRGTNGSYDVYYSSAFAIGDTLYLMDSDSISTWHTGDAEAVSYALRYPAEEDEADVSWSCWPFTANDTLYAIALATRYGEHTEFVRAMLCTVTLVSEDDGNVALLSEHRTLDWSDMIDRYEQDSTAREPQYCVGSGNTACMVMSGGDADQLLRLLNVETGEIKSVKGIADIHSVTPYRNGTLLIEQYNYDEPDVVRFTALDPTDGRSTQIARLQMDSNVVLTGVAYDAVADAVFCIKGGEIHRIDMEKCEIEPAIADAPVESFSDAGACVLSDGYYCYASSGAFVRNLDPAQRTETRIRVFDNSYLESVQSAAIALSDAHSEASAAIDRDYSAGEHLSEKLKNRDDSIDVYILDSTNKAFDAILRNGDMMALDGSEKLTALADRMYPDIRNALSRDGRLMAIPLSCSASAFAVNEKALEHLGYKLEDVPHNWMDMLDFIVQLSESVKPGEMLTVFYSGEPAEEARNTLLNQILFDYRNYADHTTPISGYDTALLRGLLEKLNAIDFTKFGCKHLTDIDGEGDAASEGDSEETDDALQLFETFSGCAFNSILSFTPILMSMDAKTPASLALDTTIAFINPSTKHPKEALLYMEQLADRLGNDTLYAIDPSLNTAIRSSDYEEVKAALTGALEALKQVYEKADVDEKQEIAAQLREQEEEIAAFEQNSWDIAQANIDWYRANDGRIVLQGVDWLFSETEGDAGSLVEQYLAGKIDAEALLSGIDKKLSDVRIKGKQ